MVTGSTAEIKFSRKQDVTGHKEGAKNMAPLLFWGQGRNMLIINLHIIWGCSNPPPKPQPPLPKPISHQAYFFNSLGGAIQKSPHHIIINIFHAYTWDFSIRSLWNFKIEKLPHN